MPGALAATAKDHQPLPAKRRVALISMPFADHRYPSLALSTFAAALRQRGHRADIYYLNLDAVVGLGLRRYYVIQGGTGWHGLIGEWLFSSPSVAPGAADPETYRQFLGRWGDGVAIDMGYFGGDPGMGRHLFDELDLTGARADLDALLERWVSEIDWRAYDVVGFSVVFQQLNASLRLAERIKAQHPTVKIVLGGGALESPMGEAIADRHPWLDAVFIGFADFSFPDWIDALPAVTERIVGHKGPQRPLDDLPIPTFDDYLRQVRAAGLYRRGVVRVAVETSRGCWWGEKKHCTFCGFNNNQMQFRHKSSERVIRELRELARYGEPVYVVDNIMPRHYFRDVFPKLLSGGFRLPGAFFFLKSNMTRREMEALVEVGVTWVQPGIESLSTPVLETMNKGVTAIRNIWMLRACEELCLHPIWGLVYGFPGEAQHEYGAMTALIPRIAHLPAPTGSLRVLLCRYSPMHIQQKELGLTDVRPARAYGLAHGAHDRLGDQAYTFDYRLAGGADPDTYAAPLTAAIARWTDLRGLPLAARCEVLHLAGRRLLFDSRAQHGPGRAFPRIRVIDDGDWEILQILESPTRLPALRRRYAGADLDIRLRELEKRRLVLHLDGRYLRLVVVRANPSVLGELRRVAADKLEKLRYPTVASLQRRSAFRHEARASARRIRRALGLGG